MRQTISLALSPLLLIGCIALDDDPDVYVEALKPDLYFVVPLQAELTAALVLFRTAQPDRPTPLHPEIRLISWANEGGNIYDGSLGDTTLRSPKPHKGLWLWAGDLVFPRDQFGQGGADKVGIELHPFLPVVGYNAAALTGAYAAVDFMGAGITTTGSWIDAILQVWAQCRGVVGQLVPCHGLSHVVAPFVDVTGFGRNTRANSDQMSDFLTIHNGVVCFDLRADGWYYRAVDMGWTQPVYGPFADPEDVARAAVAALGLRHGFLDGVDRDPELERLVAAVNHHVEEARAQRP